MASCKNDFLCTQFFVIRILSFVNHRHNYTIYLKITRKEGMIKPCKTVRLYPEVFLQIFLREGKSEQQRGEKREKNLVSLSALQLARSSTNKNSKKNLWDQGTKAFIIKQILLINITRNVWEQWKRYAGWYSTIPGLRLSMIWRFTHI